MPPAFVLSQDQTLKFDSLLARTIVELGTQRAVLKLTKSQKARTADCLTDTPPPTLPFPIYIVKEQNETDNRSQTGAKIRARLPRLKPAGLRLKSRFIGVEPNPCQAILWRYDN